MSIQHHDLEETGSVMILLTHSLLIDVDHGQYYQYQWGIWSVLTPIEGGMSECRNKVVASQL